MPDPAIPFETLVAYVSGELPPAEERTVLAHLDAAGMTAVAARLQRVIATMRTDRSEAPTPAAVRRALAEFRLEPTRSAPRLAALGDLRRIVADLVFDSRGQTALAGFRGGGGMHQLGFESELARVGVQITEPEDAAAPWRVRGQVLGAERPSGVALVEGDDVVVTATPDDTGQFTFEAASGTYEIRVEFADRGSILIMPEVELEPRS